MSDKGSASICPKCGYNENKKRNPFILSHRTILHDQFMIGRILGKLGGFGITYLGWELKLETCVAIKEYLPRDLASRNTDRSTVIPYSREDGEIFNYGLKQFLQEARTLAKFDHANVVRVRTFFEENDTAYLVMDYYEGGFRDSPNPDSGRVKKVGGIAGRRTGTSATFRYFGLLCFS
jgi:serine/threonine protein kinase